MDAIPSLFIKAMADAGMDIDTIKYPQLSERWVLISGVNTRLPDVIYHDIEVVEHDGQTTFMYRIPEDRGKGNVHAVVTFTDSGEITVYTMRPILGLATKNDSRSIRKTQVFDYKDPSFTGFEEIIAIIKKAIEPLEPCTH